MPDDATRKHAVSRGDGPIRYDTALLRSERSAIAAQVQRLHRERGDAWVGRDVEAYLSYYWENAQIAAADGRLSVDDLRRALTSAVQAGGGPLSIDLPPAEDLVISDDGSAVVTAYDWRSTYRMADGVDYERLTHETNVWYRQSGLWKIIRMHLTRLHSTPLSAAR